MLTKNSQEFNVTKLFIKFIHASKSGRRLQPNGKRISHGTINNYAHTLQLLQKFEIASQFKLSIKNCNKLRAKEALKQQKYWKRFYQLFTGYLYTNLGCYDNYVGVNIKNIRVFFGYLKQTLGYQIGDFYKSFYVRKEEIEIFPLTPDQLRFLINDKCFENRLTKRLCEVKDFFVFGCTVALRFSDLIALRTYNLYVRESHTYLSVKSIKTGIETKVKLPDYATSIVNKYAKQNRRLLPEFNNSNLNKYVKLLMEKAGFLDAVRVTRNRRGIPVLQKRTDGKILRFCDTITTHTMRRTAITTMLSLGMPEQVVRRISGHAPAGKEFYRYVSWSQSVQDQESEQVFKKLSSITTSCSHFGIKST